MMLQIGQQVGNYRIVAEIAQGVYAYVYKASNPMLTDRFVALKLLHTTFVGTEGKPDILTQEAHLLEHLQHPHILALVDFNVYEGYPYIVKAYASRGSLRDRLRKLHGRPMPTHNALSLLHQIGEGLQFAHQQRVVHCDLKPENILFNAHDEALIADFDIAQILKTARSRANSIGGTPSYMSPEQFHGKVSSASDQYALACMAYEMLTGKRPFEGKNQDEIRHMHLHEDPVPPTQINPGLPFHMDQAFLRALARDDRERFPDVAAFITALDPVQDPSVALQLAYTAPRGQHLILSDHPAQKRGKKRIEPVDENIYYEDTVAWSEEEVTVADPVPAQTSRPLRTPKKSSTAVKAPGAPRRTSGRKSVSSEAATPKPKEKAARKTTAKATPHVKAAGAVKKVSTAAKATTSEKKSVSKAKKESKASKAAPSTKKRTAKTASPIEASHKARTATAPKKRTVTKSSTEKNR